MKLMGHNPLEDAAERAANRSIKRAGREVRRTVDSAVSSVVWAVGFGILFLCCIPSSLVGLGGYIYFAEIKPSIGGQNQPNDSPGEPSESTWDGKKVFKCSGRDSVRLEGLDVDFKGPVAIQASGSCRLELIDVNLKANKIAIKAMGSAHVIIRSGRIEGGKHAIFAIGKARIEGKGGAEVVGDVKKVGSKVKVSL